MASLSLVGKEMRNMVGIAGRMFTTLAQGNVNIEMISQGASEINISCVIDARDAVKALNLIHQSCLQIKPEGARGRGELLSSMSYLNAHFFSYLVMQWDLGYSRTSHINHVRNNRYHFGTQNPIYFPGCSATLKIHWNYSIP